MQETKNHILSPELQTIVSLYNACMSSDLTTLEQIILSHPELIEGNNMESPLEFACKHNKPSVVDFLLLSPNLKTHANIERNDFNPMRLAVREGNTEIIEFVLDKCILKNKCYKKPKVLVNKKNLHQKMLTGMLKESIVSNRLDITTLLLTNKNSPANVNFDLYGTLSCLFKNSKINKSDFIKALFAPTNVLPLDCDKHYETLLFLISDLLLDKELGPAFIEALTTLEAWNTLDKIHTHLVSTSQTLKLNNLNELLSPYIEKKALEQSVSSVSIDKQERHVLKI